MQKQSRRPLCASINGTVHGFPLDVINVTGQITGTPWPSEVIYKWLGDPVAAVPYYMKVD
jgi:hypothetical protein|tara:strand:+ start:4933 stop:5112 length:180 start_codon:yes stop_codon:yes gene_type:complete